MTLKLTQQQAEALYNLFVTVILPEKPVDIAESLIKDLMVKVYKKLRNCLESKHKGKGYSLSVTDEEAKAYYLYFQGRYLGENWRYEATMIQTHTNLINKIYA